MKNNKLFIAGLVTVFIALCSLTLVSSTWAKYTSTASGSDSARVAKWSFTYKGGDAAEQAATTAGDTLTFNLFNTIKEENITDDESDIAATDGSIIAPGTGGSFTFTLKNESEVNAVYTIDYTEELSNSTLPIVYSVNNLTWFDSIDNIDVSTAQAINMGKTVEVTVYWKWLFDGDDTVDTTLGNAGNETVKVTLSIKMTQVD